MSQNIEVAAKQIAAIKSRLNQGHDLNHESLGTYIRDALVNVYRVCFFAIMITIEFHINIVCLFYFLCF